MARSTLTDFFEDLSRIDREFLVYEAEARKLGGTVPAHAFRDVKAKFYDVLVRTDVGTVDVSWSQKEDADEDLRRIELDRTQVHIAEPIKAIGLHEIQVKVHVDVEFPLTLDVIPA